MFQPQLPSPSEPDWTREKKTYLEWSPAKSLLKSIRAYELWSNSKCPLAGIFSKFTVIRHRFWSMVTGAEIPLGTEIGGGLLMPHPNGIVIHPKAQIGPNCLILQQVTLGGDDRGAPILGGNVDIGAGAKVLGPVRIGNHVRIGANAVVTAHVDDGLTVAGVPARVLIKKPLDG